LEALANVEYARGNLGAAEEYCRQQVEGLRRACPPTDPKLAWALRNYAFLVFRNRGPAQAEPIYRESLAICVAYGEQHPEVAFTLEHLARIRADQDDLEGAMELHQRELKIRRAVHGDEHDKVAAALKRTGEAAGRLGRFEEAEALLLESHAILTANHGEFSQQLSGTVTALVTLYNREGECELADEWRATLSQISTDP
jgi:tetratricopeptide (TPR) repeat protein